MDCKQQGTGEPLEKMHTNATKKGTLYTMASNKGAVFYSAEVNKCPESHFRIYGK